jgi:hypothetical protein
MAFHETFVNIYSNPTQDEPERWSWLQRKLTLKESERAS